ncbi:MAG TPA: hypothetical protein VL157_03085 [Gemmatimonadaceae bacterium]|jgi:hypothetical protein|nr:hypothetical protein [Gemmatimonadaceae bacterium]
MIPALTSSYRDWGFVALGFSAAALIEIGLAALSSHAVATPMLWRCACAALVGPLVVWSLLLDATVPHRIVLVIGGLALAMYVVLSFR